MPSIVQKLDELIVAAGGQPTGSGLPIDKKVEQASSALKDNNYILNSVQSFSPVCYSSVYDEDENYLYLDHILTPKENLFYLFWSDTDGLIVDDYAYVTLLWSIPLHFFGKHKVFRIVNANSTEDKTLTLSDWNGQYLGDQYQTLNNTWYKNRLPSNSTEVGNWSLFRFGIELTIGNEKRYILSSQLSVKKLESGIEVVEHHFNEYDDVVTEAFYASVHANQSTLSPNAYTNKVCSFTHGVDISSGSTPVTGWKVKVPKSNEIDDKSLIFPVFITHKGYFIGNFVKIAKTSSQGGN